MQESNENGSKTSTGANAFHSRQSIAQNFLLIWVNANIDKSTEDYRSTIRQLRSVVNDINMFTKLDEAVDFLTDINEMKAFLIVDDSIDEQVMSFIHDIPQLHSVYIFGTKQAQPEQPIKKWVKISGVYTDPTSICEVLHEAAEQCDQDLFQ